MQSRWFLVALSLLLIACGRREAQGPPPFTVRPANELLIQRVEAAYSAVRRSGELWPDFDKTDVVAMLIYDAKGEWFFGEAGDLQGFYRTGQTFHGVSITYAQPSLFLTGEVKPYRTIKKTWLGRIGWRDFDPDAPYRRTEPMMILQELSTAMKNHPQIRTTEDWIGVYVHECFHVFQKRFTDVMRAMRVPPGAQTDSRDALERFAASGEYRKALVKEFVVLNGAVTEGTTKESAKQTLRRWLALRRQRIHAFAAEFRRAGGEHDLESLDMALTSSEGTARYVEHRYIENASRLTAPILQKDPSSLQWVPEDAAEGAREFRTVRTYTALPDEYVYAFGDLVSRLLDVAADGWKARAFERSNLLIGAVEAAIE